MFLFRDILPYAWFGNIMNCRKQFSDNLGVVYVKITLKMKWFVLEEWNSYFKSKYTKIIILCVYNNNLYNT